MEQNTHRSIDSRLVGTVVELSPGKSRVTLCATADMAADHRGLVHGGFTFGLADYAAMVAVNDPHVVLGAATSKFLAPVTVGQEMAAAASVVSAEGRKRVVEVSVTAAGRPVFQGSFTTFVLPRHVLDS
ncbi:MAG: PaaI family thioesterase [Deferrisomatales bacterium]|nr:PaaI family thioesterase [Deferrisomatales bacterium]